jgi:hypothetical protein
MTSAFLFSVGDGFLFAALAGVFFGCTLLTYRESLHGGIALWEEKMVEGDDFVSLAFHAPASALVHRSLYVQTGIPYLAGLQQGIEKICHFD